MFLQLAEKQLEGRIRFLIHDLQRIATQLIQTHSLNMAELFLTASFRRAF